MVKHFTAISDTDTRDLRELLDIAIQLKKEYRSGGNKPLLAGKTLALVFEKPSLRTRVSFQVAMHHLSGHALMIRQEEIGLGQREPVKDVARVLSGMCDGIMARTFEHEKVLDFARYASVPVINGLTDLSHPCQAMADLLTIEEHFGSLAGRTLAFIGDANNVARSLACACGKFGLKFTIASPKNHAFPAADISRMKGQVPALDLFVASSPAQAVAKADVVYTDTWVSMGQEKEKQQRIADFRDFQVNAALMAKAPPHAVVMHCLPAYRDYEITDEVVEGPRSLVFPQAENRLHFQKALLARLMAPGCFK